MVSNNYNANSWKLCWREEIKDTSSFLGEIFKNTVNCLRAESPEQLI